MEFKRLPDDRFVLLLTLACNMQCQHCLREFNRSPHIDTELAFKAISEASELGFPDVHFTGGEPCLHPDFVALCEYTVLKNMRIFVTTNGSLPDKYAFLMDKKYWVRKMPPSFRMSLDGPTAEVHDAQRKAGSFDKAIATFHRFKAAGFFVKIHSCISKINYPHLQEMLEFFRTIKPAQATLGSVINTSADNAPITLTPEERQNAVQQVRQFRLKFKDDPSVQIQTTGSLANGTGPRFCGTLRHERSTVTLNPYGAWSFCCDLGKDGDMSIGRFPEVSVAQAILRGREIVEELVAYRLDYYQKNTRIEPWFDLCEFCHEVLKPKFEEEGIDTSRKVIPVKEVKEE